jgi:hypothetical protein
MEIDILRAFRCILSLSFFAQIENKLSYAHPVVQWTEALPAWH